MKELVYVMSLMAKYRTLEQEEKSSAVRTTVNNDCANWMHNFKYTKLFHNHVAYCNAVDL
jgi:hypothetical protein